MSKRWSNIEIRALTSYTSQEVHNRYEKHGCRQTDVGQVSRRFDVVRIGMATSLLAGTAGLDLG